MKETIDNILTVTKIDYGRWAVGKFRRGEVINERITDIIGNIYIIVGDIRLNNLGGTATFKNAKRENTQIPKQILTSY